MKVGVVRAIFAGLAAAGELERLCANASGAIVSQAFQHDAHQSEIYLDLFIAGELLVAFDESGPYRKPGECSLYDPSLAFAHESLWRRIFSQSTPTPSVTHTLRLLLQGCSTIEIVQPR